MLFYKNRRQSKLEDALKELGSDFAFLKGEAKEATERLALLDEYEAVKKALTDKEIELTKVREQHDRANREIEHKLGLHKLQVEQERQAAVKEAELAVREESLKAQKEQANQQIEFIQRRMENEMEAHRAILNQMLERLPKFTHSRVEHIGSDPDPSVKLELTKGDSDS